MLLYFNLLLSRWFSALSPGLAADEQQRGKVIYDEERISASTSSAA
ncbi:MAG: hypothetical protein J07HQW2_03006 [Haloquadratum walsbyi J07HQW2]|uniref:Uncharacterized protein n=1 Tax=Haloquadratum walsbyi J07HQW2 TaxID=1238425 RepID=U1PVT5_9EURY|nr:MAG: hypothetical protein J07HQW2_03006 [Haloquadratum walsbyi J07HQW2]